MRLLGGDQFRKFCVVVMIILVITVAITCVSQDEKERTADIRDKKERCDFQALSSAEEIVLTPNLSSKFVDVLKNIWNAVVHLPKPIRRVCYVQFFAFMGWFPFLFYA